MSHELNIAFTSRDEPLPSRSARRLFGDDALVQREIELIFRTSGAKTIGDMLDVIEGVPGRLEPMTARECRDLLSAGRIRAKITTKTVDQELAELDRAAALRASRPIGQLERGPGGGLRDIDDLRRDNAQLDAEIKSNAAKRDALRAERQADAAERRRLDDAVRGELPERYGGRRR